MNHFSSRDSLDFYSKLIVCITLTNEGQKGSKLHLTFTINTNLKLKHRNRELINKCNKKILAGVFIFSLCGFFKLIFWKLKIIHQHNNSHRITETKNNTKHKSDKQN